MPAGGHEATRPAGLAPRGSTSPVNGSAAAPIMRVFLGLPSQIRAVRSFVSGALQDSPAAADVVLLASELAANAVVHTASGKGGTFTVLIRPGDSTILVEVHDGGSDTIPAARPSTGRAESGRGLAMIDSLAARWGHLGGRDGRVVWFEVAL